MIVTGTDALKVWFCSLLVFDPSKSVKSYFSSGLQPIVGWWTDEVRGKNIFHSSIFLNERTKKKINLFPLKKFRLSSLLLYCLEVFLIINAVYCARNGKTSSARLSDVIDRPLWAWVTSSIDWLWCLHIIPKCCNFAILILCSRFIRFLSRFLIRPFLDTRRSLKILFRFRYGSCFSS